jgi:hypothetical protein
MTKKLPDYLRVDSLLFECIRYCVAKRVKTFLTVISNMFAVKASIPVAELFAPVAVLVGSQVRPQPNPLRGASPFYIGEKSALSERRMQWHQSLTCGGLDLPLPGIMDAKAENTICGDYVLSVKLANLIKAHP